MLGACDHHRGQQCPYVREPIFPTQGLPCKTGPRADPFQPRPGPPRCLGHKGGGLSIQTADSGHAQGTSSLPAARGENSHSPGGHHLTASSGWHPRSGFQNQTHDATAAKISLCLSSFLPTARVQVIGSHPHRPPPKKNLNLVYNPPPPISLPLFPRPESQEF